MLSIFRALRRLVEDLPDVCVVYPPHLDPSVDGPAREQLGGCQRIHLVRQFVDLLLKFRRAADGSIFGIDHGVSFHAQWKVRTVIWDFACEPIPPSVCADLHRLADDLRGSARQGPAHPGVDLIFARAHLSCEFLAQHNGAVDQGAESIDVQGGRRASLLFGLSFGDGLQERQSQLAESHQ